MAVSVNRRQFLQSGAVAGALCGGLSRGGAAQTRHNTEAAYQAEVPDSLDLAERAALAVHGLTSITESRNGICEVYNGAHLDQHPAYMTGRLARGLQYKTVHALPMLRIMSGSNLNADVDLGIMETLIRYLDEDGLFWGNRRGGAPFPVTAHARLMIALMDWHKYDSDPRWVQVADRMAHGLVKMAIRKDGHAWYATRNEPPGGSEPVSQPCFDMGLPLHALARWYAESCDKAALEVADELARFMLKPAMWESAGPKMLVGAEHGRFEGDVWEGHFHARTMGVMGLLEYAVVKNDTRLKRFVADFYEYARCFGISRMGFFPSVIPRLDKPHAPIVAEGCGVADMTWLAARLSEAGVGDYWEDVDQYARNQLVEFQFVRLDLLQHMSAAGPSHNVLREMETTDHVLERNIGTFSSGSDPTMLYGNWTLCCVGNCAVSLYKAWTSIVQGSNEAAQVNLLLNRASPWLDVDSYLPYEGKVVLTNKTAKTVYVRIPIWADKRQVQCQVNGRPKPPRWLNNYLIVDQVSGGDKIVVELPLVTSTETYTVPTYPDRYTCQFKGNTLVDISPRPGYPALARMRTDDGVLAEASKGYPIYQRDLYRQSKAPMKKVQRYVSAVMI